jgi:hypothetical protein
VACDFCVSDSKSDWKVHDSIRRSRHGSTEFCPICNMHLIVLFIYFFSTIRFYSSTINYHIHSFPLVLLIQFVTDRKKGKDSLKWSSLFIYMELITLMRLCLSWFIRLVLLLYIYNARCFCLCCERSSMFLHLDSIKKVIL